MDERKMFILGAILQSYIKDGQPLGSRTLQRDYQMGVSAATIRNEMSDLEHLGFLEKAHTSSGRIPAEKAYRWYVDGLLERGTERDEIPALGSRSLLKQSLDPDTLLDRALSLLSDLTDGVAFALLPGRDEDVLDKIRFLPLSPKEVMIVCVYESKFVETDLIHLDTAYSEDRLERLGEIFGELLEGRTLRDVTDFLHSDYFSTSYKRGNLMSELVPVLSERVEESRRAHLRFQGLGKWFRVVEEADMPEALRFLEELQSGGPLLEVLSTLQGSKGVQVRIGAENASPILQNAALVTVPYYLREGVSGQLGVLGPMRMHYRNVISHVRRMGRYIDSITRRA